jgi:hypothetical protein
MTIDAERLRELAAELGFWPATTDEADIERHRQHNKNADYWLARSHRFDHLRGYRVVPRARTLGRVGCLADYTDWAWVRVRQKIDLSWSWCRRSGYGCPAGGWRVAFSRAALLTWG